MVSALQGSSVCPEVTSELGVGAFSPLLYRVGSQVRFTVCARRSRVVPSVHTCFPTTVNLFSACREL